MPTRLGIVTDGFGSGFFVGPNQNVSSSVFSVNLNSGNASQTEVIMGTQTSNSSSILNINSTNRGLLIPRMTLTQRNAIASPAAGLQVIVTGETGGEFVSMYNSSLAAWVNATSKWSTNANGINYNGGRVGIGTATSTINPISLFTVSNDALTTVQNDTTGIMLANNTAATAGTTMRTAPALEWKASDFVSGAARDVRYRMWPGSVAGNHEFILEKSINGGSTWINCFTVNSGTTLQQIRIGNNIFGENITTTGTVSSAAVQATNAITSSGSSGSTFSGTRIGANITYNFSTGTNIVNNFAAQSQINNTAGTNTIRGFFYNPTNTNLTGTTSIGFQNTTGNNLFVTTSGSVGIGANTSIAPSAILDVTSTTQGVLFPRMTTTQKLAIGSPAAGLQVYDTTLNQMSYYNGTTWVNF
jgi:hypothetical protein